MLEILERAFSRIPSYFVDLGTIIGSPKSFVAGLDLDSRKVFEQSVVFAGITVALLVASGALIARTDPTQLAANAIISAILTAVQVCLVALAVMLAWRIVGWRATPLAIFTIVTYYTATAGILAQLGALLQFGILRAIDPDLANAIFESLRSNRGNLHKYFSDIVDASKDKLGIVILVNLLSSITVAIVLAWLIVAWGAFRQLNGFSKTRSAVAFILAVVFAIPMSSLVIAIMAAVF